MSGAFHVHGHPGVPVCLVWDTDSGNDDRANPRIDRGLQGPAGPETPAGQNPLAPRFGPRYSCPDASLSAATIGQVEGIEGLLAARMRYYGLNPNREGDKKKAVHNQRIVYDVLCAAKRGKNGLDSLPTVRILNWVVRMRKGLDGQARQEGAAFGGGGQDPAPGAQDPPGRTLRAVLAAAHGAGREMPAPSPSCRRPKVQATKGVQSLPEGESCGVCLAAASPRPKGAPGHGRPGTPCGRARPAPPALTHERPASHAQRVAKPAIPLAGNHGRTSRLGACLSRPTLPGSPSVGRP